ncbi:MULTISPECIES: NAD(+) diphosphatase [unclassified Arthrobacter]|uniref:NAD(+) diphosphatase n=1 Tax=unclassified Arthrobacter TaxID=235627 RepID=UPI001E2B36DC|nr:MULTISPECIES: NAD(+) diphosphatase [unclassified Arthrobacter]MCC9146416.1 NAD(+) diphosphatase [Arthrobacter sp. zg-Y919]MDK1277646.1 NAD(+) diphosphatase [Arthrobacter sp. zg.Y919]MDM7989854.1 NAD(+) diphosphatase [Arthrobacter sp. zg-Y877]WIB02392.1 NAD(+) diphosphatase [Arthrobacter sp. zg-Y919]
MSIPAPAAEVSPLGLLPLARTAVDRGSDRRVAADLFDTIRADGGTRVMYLAGGRTLVREGVLVLLDPPAAGFGDVPIYLGRTLEDAQVPLGTDIVLMTLPEPDPALAVDGAAWVSLRESATHLGALDAGLFVEAAAVANWHAVHTHCPRCGAPTVPEQGGWVRRCPEDGSSHFPRTDPAIIVAVVDEQDRILLGSAAAWPGNRYSTLAGFVEPGESLEAAVIREVAEESGVVVHTPQYLGSQPWPFPCSLMLGFTARAENAEAKADGVEMSDVRWFSRAELAEAVSSGEITIAGPISIARNLIERWYGGSILEPEANTRA